MLRWAYQLIVHGTKNFPSTFSMEIITRFCSYTGQYGSVKTRILANFLQCILFCILEIWISLCIGQFLNSAKKNDPLSAQWQSFFSSWTQSSAGFLKILNVTSDHSCRKYFRILTWKCLDITTWVKSHVYNNFNLRYFMSSDIESLNKFFSVHKNICL